MSRKRGTDATANCSLCEGTGYFVDDDEPGDGIRECPHCNPFAPDDQDWI